MSENENGSVFDTNNPDVLEALSSRYGNRTVLLIPLRSGNVAIFGRDFELYAILPDAPTREQLFEYSTNLNIKLFRKTKLDEESRFYGEPSAKQMAKDLKATNGSLGLRPRQRDAGLKRDIKTDTPKTNHAIELDLDNL